MALDRNWRKSKQEKERLKGKKEQTGGAIDIVTTLSVAEEANAFSVGDNRACSDGGSREN